VVWNTVHTFTRTYPNTHMSTWKVSVATAATSHELSLFGSCAHSVPHMYTCLHPLPMYIHVHLFTSTTDVRTCTRIYIHCHCPSRSRPDVNNTLYITVHQPYYPLSWHIMLCALPQTLHLTSELMLSIRAANFGFDRISFRLVSLSGASHTCKSRRFICHARHMPGQ
jgi:hypothetical protein